MINAPQSIIDALESENISEANLVTVNLGDAYDTGYDVILYLTDYAYEISFDGHTFTPDNNLIEIEGISRKASTGSDVVDIVFSVTDEHLIDIIKTERYINKPTKIDRVIIENGAVLADFSIPIRTAWGLSHSISGELGNRAITLSIDSILGDLKGDNAWYAINSSHEQRYAGDKIMRHSSTVMTEEQQKKYTTNFSGTINNQVKPPALSKVYGYKNVELVPICMLKHRKSHSSYRHYFTTFIYAINIGECNKVDIANLRQDNEKFDGKIVSGTARDVGGWSAKIRTPSQAANGDLLSEEDNGELSFWFEGMDSNEKNRMIGMQGKGLTLLFVKNRNRDDWVNNPPNFTVPVQGAEVYDPRSGSTVFSRNPALQYADYLKSTEYGAGNRGVPQPSDDDISALADHFDAIPDSEGNDGINSILIDVQVDTGKPLVDNMNIWMEGVRLYTSDYYGKFNIRVETKSPVVWSIDESELKDYPDYDSGEFTDRLNQLTYTVKQLVGDIALGTYTTPQGSGHILTNYGYTDLVEVSVEATFPPEGSQIHSDWLAEDGGVPSFDSQELNYVTVLEQAYYWAMVDSRISRQPRTLDIKVGVKGWLSEVGDVIRYSSSVMGMTDELWRVDEVSEDDREVELKLVAYDDSFYTPDPNTVPDPVEATQPPTSTALSAVSGMSIISDKGFYYLTWLPLSSENVSWYAVEVKKDDALIIDEPKVAQPPLLLESITTGNYQANITAIGNNTEGEEASLLFTVELPVAPTFEVTVDTFEVEIALETTSRLLGVSFELKLGTTNDESTATTRGTGSTFTLVNLSPSTTYYAFARTINIAGKSEWSSVNFTTLDGQKYVDLIEDFEPVDLTEFQESLEEVEQDVEELLVRQIWTTVQLQEKTTADTYSKAEIKETNVTLADETIARVDQGQQITASINGQQIQINSTITRLDSVEVKANGNASAISVISGTVYDANTGLSASYSLAQSAKITADGAASSTTVLSNKVNDPETGLDATAALVTTAQSNIEGLQAQAYLFVDANNRIAGVKLSSDGTQSSLDFVGDKVRFVDSSGNPAIYFDVSGNRFAFDGKIIIGNESDNYFARIDDLGNARFGVTYITAPTLYSGASLHVEGQNISSKDTMFVEETGVGAAIRATTNGAIAIKCKGGLEVDFAGNNIVNIEDRILQIEARIAALEA